MSLVEQTAYHPATATDGGVLIVSDATDQEIRGFRAGLEQRGVPFDSVSDVYAATALLAHGGWTGKIFVDVRALDEKEMAFLRLVPRFFAHCEMIVPAFEGTGDRPALRTAGLSHVAVEAALNIAGAGGGRPTLSVAPEPVEAEPAVAEIPQEPVIPDVEVEESVIAAGLDEEAETPTRPAEAETVPGLEEPAAAGPVVAETPDAVPTETPPLLRLSTDGGPEEAGSGPALHEVVRMRMASSEERRPIRRAPLRTPPGGTPPGMPPVIPPAGAAEIRPHGLDSMLSPDEMDALLRDDDVAAGETPPTNEAEGGEE